MAFKNPIATLLFILLHETPFQFARRIVRDWEMRKQMANSSRRPAGGCGGCGDGCGSLCYAESYAVPHHDDDRLIPGCDSVGICEHTGRWIELGGEG